MRGKGGGEVHYAKEKERRERVIIEGGGGETQLVKGERKKGILLSQTDTVNFFSG